MMMLRPARILTTFILGSCLVLSLAACSSASPSSSTANGDVDVDVDLTTGIHATDYEVRVTSSVANGTYRPDAEIKVLVTDAIRAKLATRSDIDVDFSILDPTTSPNALRITGSVPLLQYTSGNLKTTVRLTVFRYQSNTLLGSITKTVTMQGVPPIDQAAEDQVISVAASMATETFMNNFL